MLQSNPHLAFSISACTRSPRPGEVEGKDYYFLDEASFLKKVDKQEFIEWESVYTGKYYGTLKSELERIWHQAKTPLVDIDVQGAVNIKNKYPEQSLSIFIQAPSLEELGQRLKKRGTETEASLQERIAKAKGELTYASLFDKIVVNDNLEDALDQISTLIENFIDTP